MTLLDPTTQAASPEDTEERAPSPEARPGMPRVGVERRRMGPLERVVATGLLLPVRFYRRFLSPLKPPTCRFHPTCSAYFLEAVQKHGPLRGSWMGIKRLLKCHPYHRGGYDPVE